MNKKYLLNIAVILLIIAGFFLLAKKPQQKTSEILITGNKLQIEIMQTEEEKAKGLSDRKNLCSNCGLLFVYDHEGIYSFWMRRMYFDIDILWLVGDRVVDITYGAKKPSKEDFERPREVFQSKQPVDKVLEVNVGWVEKNGIKAGDKLEIRQK